MSPSKKPRMDRVNQVVQEVLGDELERIDDARLELVTITGVRVEPGLSHAVVWFSSLSTGDPEGAAVALGEYRIRMQSAIARQLRLRGTPLLTFVPDPAIALGSRVEELLRGLDKPQEGS
ncbi:MAG: 30S ribosome-binding factor RbfA [Actinomycetota bacterium]|nr:30S ribosome-binding factor RbfA [Actinomycetota bacterium]